jgi:hypothetical protein
MPVSGIWYRQKRAAQMMLLIILVLDGELKWVAFRFGFAPSGLSILVCDFSLQASAVACLVCFGLCRLFFWRSLCSTSRFESDPQDLDCGR